MAAQPIGIIMNGVTGRMGTNQHLIRSIVAIRNQGGVALPNGDALMPDPILVGRNEHKLRALAAAHGVERCSTDLDACLADPRDTIYFDAQTTTRRAAAVRAAIAAGKHIYCEKPVAADLATALDMARLAGDAGVKNGVVQDKLWLPGLLKLKRLVEGGFFGRILSVRGEFGYWVFEGDWQSAQRPSWNYRKQDDGGIIVDMLCHWRYVLDNLFGPVRAVSCLGATHIPERVDEQGQRYAATADDAAYATFQLDGGAIAQINSSWCVRVYRDELFSLQVDGTEGSAGARRRRPGALSGDLRADGAALAAYLSRAHLLLQDWSGLSGLPERSSVALPHGRRPGKRALDPPPGRAVCISRPGRAAARAGTGRRADATAASTGRN
jgi:predicted dehydrogenase